MSSRPVVALLSVGELFGGVERHLLGMCRFLQRRGEEPRLILFHDRELATQARALGLEPVILAGGSFDLSLPRRLADLLAADGVEVVHAHGYRAVVNAALARRHHPFAMVRTVHGLIEPARPLTAEWFKSHLYSGLETFFSRRSGAAVCYVTDDLRRHHEGPAGRGGRTVHNGIDPVPGGEFPRPEDLPSGRRHFAAVGRISPVKGLETLLQALRIMDETLPVTVDLIGTGPSRERLEKLASGLKLGSRVRFLGFKKNVHDYLAHVDGLVMPSRHEGLPYTILEALSLGTPIIASRVGGLREVLTHERDAILLDPGDTEGWAAAMTALARDTARARRLGEAGRRLQAERLTLETMGQAYWQIYKERVNGGLVSPVTSAKRS